MRSSIRATLALLSCVLLPAGGYAAADTLARNMKERFTGATSVLQNHTTDRFLSATILRHKSDRWEYVLYDANGKNVSGSMELTGGLDVEKNHVTDQIRLPDGRPDTRYFLEIRDEWDRVVDTRMMRTLSTREESPRIAVASCSRVGLLTSEYLSSLWDRMHDLKPDIVLFLGDIVYNDGALQALLKHKPSWERIQSRYVASWKGDKLYHQFETVPVFPIWDDHEYGYNDAGHDNPHREKMLEYYRKFYPIPDLPSVVMGPGASYAFRVLGHRFVLLDDRFFGERKAKGSGGHSTTWGTEQRIWLRRQLTGEPTFIANGYAWQKPLEGKGRGSVETISPHEFLDFRNMIRASGTRALLLNGDTHFSEVRTANAEVLGYTTYQITSSRMHSFHPGITPPFSTGAVPDHPDQIYHTARSNFVILQPNSVDLDGVKVSVYPRGKDATYLELDIGTPATRTCDSLFGF